MKSRTSFRFLLVSRALLAGSVLSAAPPPAFNVIFTVNTVTDTPDATPGDWQCADAQGKCSLRAAIDEHNKLPRQTKCAIGATSRQITCTVKKAIKLPSGTYNLMGGELKITASMAVLGAGSDTTFIDAAGHNSRIFHLVNVSQAGWEPTASMLDVTIRNGQAPTSTDPGGGILVGVGSALYLTNCVVSGNKSNINGAGIANAGYLSAGSCTIRDNEITGLTSGGGVTASGGGIFNYFDQPGNYGTPVVKLNSCTISGNKATRGGGICNVGTLEIENSTISGNRVFAGGGGIDNFGVAMIAFSTITENVANLGAPQENPDWTTGGGILNFETVRMSATILANNIDNRTNSDARYSPDCYSRTNVGNAVFQSEGGNLEGIINQNWNLNVAGGDQAGTSNNPLDPRLSPLHNNGGLTMTHALRTDSPALNAAGGSFVACPRVDQRGQTRPVGPACDVGAFELSGFHRIPWPWPPLLAILAVLIVSTLALTISMLLFSRARRMATTESK
jgi:CSLREA domain-containing protein